MLKQSNYATKKAMKRRHAEISLFPCSCQVGFGRAMSFEAVKKLIRDYCRKIDAKLQVKDVGVGAKDENAQHASTVWIIDFEDPKGRFSSREELQMAVKKCITPLQGRIDGVSRKYIRTIVPVSEKQCQAGSLRSAK